MPLHLEVATALQGRELPQEEISTHKHTFKGRLFEERPVRDPGEEQV